MKILGIEKTGYCDACGQRDRPNVVDVETHVSDEYDYVAIRICEGCLDEMKNKVKGEGG